MLIYTNFLNSAHVAYLHKGSLFYFLIHLCSFPWIKLELVLSFYDAHVRFRNFGASCLWTLFFAARCLFTRTFCHENKNKYLKFLSWTPKATPYSVFFIILFALVHENINHEVSMFFLFVSASVTSPSCSHHLYGRRGHTVATCVAHLCHNGPFMCALMIIYVVKRKMW